MPNYEYLTILYKIIFIFMEHIWYVFVPHVVVGIAAVANFTVAFVWAMEVLSGMKMFNFFNDDF